MKNQDPINNTGTPIVPIQQVVININLGSQRCNAATPVSPLGHPLSVQATNNCVLNSTPTGQTNETAFGPVVSVGDSKIEGTRQSTKWHQKLRAIFISTLYWAFGTFIRTWLGHQVLPHCGPKTEQHCPDTSDNQTGQKPL